MQENPNRGTENKASDQSEYERQRDRVLGAKTEGASAASEGISADRREAAESKNSRGQSRYATRSKSGERVGSPRKQAAKAPQQEKVLYAEKAP